MGNKFIVKLILSSFFLSFNTMACEKEFSAIDFIEASHKYGKKPQSDCHRVDLYGNTFHAPPNKSCVVIFNSDFWFKNNWKFNSIIGDGTFDIKKTHEGIEVKIEKREGFKLRSIVVDINMADCSNVSMENGF